MNLRLFGKNAAIYGVGNIGLRACSFLLVPLYTYALCVRDYGLLVTLFLTTEIMDKLIGVGMHTTFPRFAKEYETRGHIGQLLGNCLIISLMSGITVTGATLLFFKPFFRSILHVEFVSEYIILACCVALLRTMSLTVMSHYRIKNQAMKFSLVGMSAAVLLFISNVVLVIGFELGVKGALLASICSHSIILVYVLMDFRLRTSRIRISISMIPNLVLFGFPLIFSMLGLLIIGSSSIYFLSHYEGLKIVAIYALGYKLATVVGIVLKLPFELAYQPFVFTSIGDPEIKGKIARMFTYYFISMAFVSLFVLLISRILLPFIAPPEYSGAYEVLVLILPMAAFQGLIVFGETLLSVARKTHVTGIIVGIFGLLSLVLNYRLVPAMGWHGAIVTTNICCLSAGLFVFILGIKAFPFPIEWSRISFASCMFAFFLGLAFLLHSGSDIIFYGGIVMAMALVFPIAKLVGFFNGIEKAAIMKGLDLIRLRVST